MFITKKETLKFLAIGLGALLLTFIIHPGAILRLNDVPLLYNYRTYTSLITSRVRPHKIVAITIDNYTLDKIGERYPFKRSRYADLIKIMDQEGVSVLGFDLVFEGESEDAGQDALLVEALRKASKTRVILAAYYDITREVHVFPERKFQEVSYGVGKVETGTRADTVVRVAGISSEIQGATHYSFLVELLAAYLNKPKRDVALQIPVAPEPLNLLTRETNQKKFRVNYQVRPEDTAIIPKFSLYDILHNLDALKKEYGVDFLKDSLVVVCTEGAMLKDNMDTPLGVMPGGYTHVNALITFLSGKFLAEQSWLSVAMIAGSFLLLLAALVSLSFSLNVLFLLAIIALNFTVAVAATHMGLFYGQFYRAVVFTFIFFLFGTLSKYLYYLYQTQKIKSRVTLDPLRGIFTLRYFYFKLDLESFVVHPGKNIYLAFLFLENFRVETEGISLAALQSVWRQMTPVLNAGRNCWAGYTQEELVGRIICPQQEIRPRITSMRNSLGAIFQEKTLSVRPRIVYVQFKKGYSLKELIYVAFKELKKSQDEILELPKETIPAPAAAVSVSYEGEASVLDSLYEDIEEKNRFLLSLVEDLNKEHARSRDMFFQVILSLVNALEARDPYTEGHSQRVAGYADMVAQQLGWNKEEREKLRKASLLHDLGKIGIPDGILHKRDRLNDEEFDFIKKHEIIAVKILEPIRELAEVLPWILYHHERWDGKGYPHGLGGNAIPVAAQLMSLADVYDALTTGRDYKKAFSPEETLAEIEKGKGAQFNPELADVFIRGIRAMLFQK